MELLKQLRNLALHEKFTFSYFQQPAQLRQGSSLSSVQGLRDAMEDSHLVATYDDLEMYGVFDGHGGDDVVKFVSRHLAEELLPPFETREKKGSSDEQLKAVVDRVFTDLDHKMFNKNMLSGCCALVCIYDKRTHDIWLINLGDSKGIVFSDGAKQVLETIELTPADPEEKERIMHAESRVIKKKNSVVDRIDGRLAVSRAFGDMEYKTPSRHSHTYTGSEGAVSVIPTFHHTRLDYNVSSTYYLLLACDGLWFDTGIVNQFKTRELMNMIIKQGATADMLTDEALERGSADNITAMIVQFK